MSTCKKLNIGCGKDIIDGFMHLDFIKGPGIDFVHDLNKFPYPLKDNYFSEILAKHIIEHLDDPEKFCEEMWRITPHGGRIIIRTPHFSCGSLSWGDLTHKRTFSTLAFHNYDINNKKLNLKSLATSKKMRFAVKKKIVFGKLHKILGLELFFNKFQGFYESFAYGFFPAREIVFDLIVVK